MRRILSSLCMGMLALPAIAAPKPPELMYLAVWPHTVVAVDANSGKVVDRITLNSDIARQLILSPDRKTLYASTLADNKIVTIDLATREVTDSFTLNSENHNVRLTGLAIDPTGKIIYALTTTIVKQLDHYEIGPQKFSVIDIAAKRITRNVDIPKEENSASYRNAMRVSPDGKYLYLFRDGIVVLDTTSFKQVKKIDLREPENPDTPGISFNPLEDPNETQEKLVGLFNSSDPYVHQDIFGIAELDLSNLTYTLTPVGPVVSGNQMSGLQLTPDRTLGYTTVTTGQYGNRVTEFWVFDMKTKKVIAKKEFTGRTRFNFGLTADGKKLLIYNAGFQIEVYDAKTMEMVNDIDLGGDTTSNLIVMPAAM